MVETLSPCSWIAAPLPAPPPPTNSCIDISGKKGVSGGFMEPIVQMGKLRLRGDEEPGAARELFPEVLRAAD